MEPNPTTAYDAYCNWVSKFWDCKDLNVALVAALVLTLCAKVYQWFKTRRNKKAVGTILLLAIAIVGLWIRFPIQIESFLGALVLLKVNVWLMLGLFFVLLWFVQKYAMKHKLRIAAVMTGPSDYFIKDGIALRDYKWKWDIEANPQTSLGQFMEVKLDGRNFYSLTCFVALPTKQVRNFMFGIKLKAKAGFSEADISKNLAPNDIGVAIGIREEGILAKLAIGNMGVGRRKLPMVTWTTDGATERRIKFQVVVNDGGNLALLINDVYICSKPIDRAALKHLALMAGGDAKKFYRASIQDIEVLTARTETDDLMERSLRGKESISPANQQPPQGAILNAASESPSKTLQNLPKPRFELPGPIEANRTTRAFETAPGDVLGSPKGSITVWVQVTQEMFDRKTSSYTYVLSHASNRGNSIAPGPKYGNGWALGLVTGNSRTWRLFLSNATGKSTKDLEDRRPLTPGWHLFAVTWSRTDKVVKLFVDGKRMATGSTENWPEEVQDNIYIGTWPNLDPSHFLDSRIAALKLFDEELSSENVQHEYESNKPSGE